MKTKILPSNSFCVGKYDGGKIIIGECTLEDCCAEREVHNYLESSDQPCLTTLVEDGEPFFFSMSRYFGGQPINQSSHIGHLESVGKKKALMVKEKISGDRISPLDGDTFLIYAYQPTNLSFLPDHHCSVMTSDAMITLEEDTYIGFKEGHIDSLTADELLEQLSHYESERSPTFKRVQLSPTLSRPDRPLAGTLIMNKFSKRLEYFDGKSWRTVKLEETEG